MTLRPFSSLLRPLLGAAAGVLLAAGLCAPLQAQVPVRPDTTRRDTAAVAIPPEAQAADTLPDRAGQDSVPADSTIPAPNFPVYPRGRGGGGGWSGTWTWSRQELSYYHGLGLLELLERVPGLLVTRTGGFGMPAGVAAYGLGGGRLRVFLDGWEMQPLGSATLDLQQIALTDLDEIRVQRGLAETRIDLTTFRLPDRRPFAQIEAGDGDFNTRILRGYFARALGGRDVVQGLFDLTDTDGFRRREPYSATTYGARWSHTFGEGQALQLEYRRLAEDRGSESFPQFLEIVDRSDLVLRGAWRFGALELHGVAGRSSRVQGGADTLAFEGEGTQLGVTAAYTLPIGTVTGEARTFRGGEGGFAPSATELSARGDFALAPAIGVAAEVRSLSRGGVTGLETEASARFTPLGGLSLFGSVSAGTRGIPFARDSLIQRRTFGGLWRPVGVDTLQTDTAVAFGIAESKLNGFRAGAEWSRGSALVGAALVRTDVDRLASFGLAWDAGLRTDTLAMGAVTAFEAYANAPLVWDWLRVDGWYARVQEAGGRPYLPQDFGRVALEYHDVFLTGNLEPTVRLEALVRGPSPTLGAAGRAFDATTQRYAIFNFFLQIRILDVRAFLLAENLLNRNTAIDITGRPLPGARTMYGVRWFFRN